jgi:hypothetical protein
VWPILSQLCIHPNVYRDSVQYLLTL